MAVEEMIGRALKKGELEDMMQKKMLDPEVLLPLVGKYFHQLANDGGALEKKLKQLAAVESRMKESWIQFVNVLYDKGVEDALIKLYKGLDRVFNSIKQLAGTAIGRFLKGALDMISETVLALLDTVQIIVYLIDLAFGSNTEAKGFAAEIVGMVVAAAALAKIFIGIKKTMMAMVGLSSAIAGGTGAAGGGIVGKVVILGAEAAFFFGLANAIIDALGIRKDLAKVGSTIYDATHQTDPNKPDFGKFSFDKITPFMSSNNIHNSVGSSIKSMQQQALLSGTPLWYQNAQPQKLDVNITMDQNAKELIKATVEEKSQQQLNSLLPPSLRTSP